MQVDVDADTAPETEEPSILDVVKKAWEDAGNDQGASDDQADDADQGENTETPGRRRDAQGRFVAASEEQPKEQSTEEPSTEHAPAETREAPGLDFLPPNATDETRKAWESAPDLVKADMAQAVTAAREMTTAFQELAPYNDIAQTNGMTLPQLLSNYMSIEQLLKSNPQDAFERIAQVGGIDFQDMALKVALKHPKMREIAQQVFLAPDDQDIGNIASSIMPQQNQQPQHSQQNLEYERRIRAMESFVQQQSRASAESTADQFIQSNKIPEQLIDDFCANIKAVKASNPHRNMSPNDLMNAAWEQTRGKAEAMASALGYAPVPSNGVSEATRRAAEAATSNPPASAGVSTPRAQSAQHESPAETLMRVWNSLG